MKPSENVRDYFGRLSIVNQIIMEAYDSYTVLPDEPVLTGNVQNDTLSMRAHVRASNLNLAKFFLLNHFRAGLPSELRRVLNLQNEDELRLNAAVKLATIEARSREESKCQTKIYATEVSENHEPQIEAVRQNQNQNWRSSNQNQYRPQNRNQNQQRKSNNQSWRQGAGNNSNKNGQTCIFCKRQGHRQGTPTVVRSGPRSTPRRATRLTTWTSLPSRSRIFSEELDGTPTSSSSSHSSADFEFVCHLCRDIQ